MGSMPYPGGGPTGAFANANGHNPQLVNHSYAKIETINDLAPKLDNTLADFPADREWEPQPRPRGRILPVTESTANASSVLLDTEIVNSVVIAANAPMTTPPSTATYIGE